MKLIMNENVLNDLEELVNGYKDVTIYVPKNRAIDYVITLEKLGYKSVVLSDYSMFTKE